MAAKDFGFYMLMYSGQATKDFHRLQIISNTGGQPLTDYGVYAILDIFGLWLVGLWLVGLCFQLFLRHNYLDSKILNRESYSSVRQIPSLK